MAASNPIQTFQKDPSAVLDYVLNWAPWLNGDVIASIVWTVGAGLTNVGQTLSGTQAVIWLSGGVAGSSYTVSALITTVGGRTDERTIQINVVDR
jgi:hypothetical protein